MKTSPTISECPMNLANFRWFFFLQLFTPSLDKKHDFHNLFLLVLFLSPQHKPYAIGVYSPVVGRPVLNEYKRFLIS